MNVDFMQKEILEQAGFEIRTDHRVGSFGSSNSYGQKYTYVVIEKSQPDIVAITEYSDWSGEDSVQFEGNSGLWGVDVLLGYGETEQEAWEVAIGNFKG